MTERTVFEDPYATVTYSPDRKLIVYRRKATPYPDLATARASLEAARGAMPLGLKLSHHVFLMDVREGPLRVDPEFEQATEASGPDISKLFKRAAVLVKTAVGKLQMSRLRNERARIFEVFDDETEAYAFLSS